MAITKEQARALAEAFHQASRDIGSYRFANWGSLSAAQRRTLEDAEWDLLNFSSLLVTTAVGIALTDMEADLEALNGATSKARKAIAKIQAVRDMIEVATAAVILGGAILSRDPNAILSASQDLFKVAKAAIDNASA